MRFDMRRHVELLIIDEAERLPDTAFGAFRDRHDRRHVATILIGMPSIDQSRRDYTKLYSRLSFSYRYRNLGEKNSSSS